MVNIAEFLKNSPKGTKLYSPLCGECCFDSLNMGTIICIKRNSQEITFTSEGYNMLPVFDDCECQLFPSKDQRDWSKFQRPFKDGDVIVKNDFIAIVSCIESNGKIWYHCWYNTRYKECKLKNDFGIGSINDEHEIRLATEEEKQKLFDAIKSHGFVWNPETKTLEKLVNPKFKVGDKIVKKNGVCVPFVITGVSDDYQSSKTENSVEILPVVDQDNWELVPNKFDVTTLKPFDKVLVRDYDYQCWMVSFFGYCDKFMGKFDTVRGVCIQCIPYEGNEHLLGTTNDCNEFYKTW